MWELALGIVQYLTKTLRGSKEHPERLFRDHVVPIHEDLLSIQRDYTRNFARLADMIADESVPTETIAAHVDRQRKELNPVRIATGELAKALNTLFAVRFAKKQPSEDSPEWLLNQYADAVIDYLYGHHSRQEIDAAARGAGDDDLDLTIGTRYTGLMRLAKAVESDAGARASLAQAVSEVEGELERTWSVLAERYGVLKARCLV